MAKSKAKYTYDAVIDSYNSGIVHHFVKIPAETAQELKAAKVKRLIVTLNGHTYKRAVQGRKDGSRHVFVSLPMLKEIGAKWGDTISVTLIADPNPDQIDLCEEFVAVLDTDEDAARAWKALTPGTQRSLAHYINEGKSADTRIERGLFMAKRMIAGEFAPKTKAVKKSEHAPKTKAVKKSDHAPDKKAAKKVTSKQRGQ